MLADAAMDGDAAQTRGQVELVVAAFLALNITLSVFNRWTLGLYGFQVSTVARWVALDPHQRRSQLPVRSSPSCSPPATRRARSP